MTKLSKTTDKNIYYDEANKVFVWREYIDGKSHWKSTGVDTIGLARQRVKEFRSSITGQARLRLRKSFDEAFDLVLKIQSAKSVKTAVMARTQIEGHLRPWFKEHCRYLGDFERAFEEYWSEYRTAQEIKTPGRKLEHDRRHLLMALKRAFEKNPKWINKRFTKDDLQLMEATESIGRLLEHDEIDFLLAETSRHRTLHLQVLMGLYMGMRKTEILHLRWDEIEFKRGTISIKGKRIKTRKARVIPIHVLILPLLKDRMAASQSDFVFPARHTNVEGTPYDYTKPQSDNSGPWAHAKANALKVVEARYLIEKKDMTEAPKMDCRFHDLRHTAISFMILAGIPDSVISQITGASLAVIKRVYLHLNLDMTERVRNLICGKFVGYSQ